MSIAIALSIILFVAEITMACLPTNPTEPVMVTSPIATTTTSQTASSTSSTRVPTSSQSSTSSSTSSTSTTTSSSTSTTTTTTTTTGPPCPTGWDFRTESSECYIVVIGGLTCGTANALCMSEQATSMLASIHDAATNAYIRLLKAAAGASNRACLGYTADPATQPNVNTWMWIDGIVSAYRNWAPSQPDNSMPAGTGCMTMQASGRWDDIGCGFVNMAGWNAVCVMPANV